MNRNRFLESIRKILAGIILPIRKKKEEWLSNFRLSIVFRISIGYLRLLLTHGILFMLGFFLIFMHTEKLAFDRMASKVIDLSIDQDKIINPYRLQGIYLKVKEKETEKEIYNDISFIPGPSMALFHEIHTNLDSDKYRLVIDEEKNIVMNGNDYIAIFQYDMTESYTTFLSLLWKLVILYLFIVYLIIRKGKKRDIKLFEPLRIMSATANRLTANNLHSERLSIEGTKNELKDLANVINEMLDRIEVSYESQKQFVSDASHELRTPIAIIQGYANLLNRWGSSNPEVLEESIEAIQNEARAMQDLVEKLLFLSRHDKKTLMLNKKRFNMKTMVEDMVKETRLVASNRIIESPILEDVVVYGDKQSLKQAIRIFIDNAIKYSEDGDRVTILCQNVNGDCVITVEDTGIGMRKKDVYHIFDRFYRSDHVRNKNISGHGLGLSLAKLIIFAHVGKIKVRTQFKKGTRFTITIPKRRY